MELLTLAGTAAVTMQLVFWIWLYVERFALSRLANGPKPPRWIYSTLAFIGALIVVCVARGLVHWGRLHDIGDPLSRRVIVSFFVCSVILYDLFRVRSKQWSFDEKMPYFWKAKWLAYCLLLPIFAIFVARVPVIADPVSIGLVTVVGTVERTPVIGPLLGAIATTVTLICDVVCGVGFVLLTNSSKRQPRP